MKRRRKKNTLFFFKRTHINIWNIAPDMLKKHAFPVFQFKITKPRKPIHQQKSESLLRILTHSHSQENFIQKKKFKRQKVRTKQKDKSPENTECWYTSSVNEMESWTSYGFNMADETRRKVRVVEQLKVKIGK